MTAVQTGRKRKRDADFEEDLNVRIGGKIHHEIKLVRKACKKAKVFEIQKVVQKLKNERTKNAEGRNIRDYETQLSCLKTVNDDAIGNSAFRSKIFKDYILRTNEAISSFVKELEPCLSGSVGPGSTLDKIQSRLLSSKILSAQVAASVESLRILVNPALKPQNDKNIRDHKDEVQPHQKLKRKDSSHQSEPFEEDKVTSPPVADDSGWESGTVGTEGEIGDAGWESDYGSSRLQESVSNLEAQPETESEDESDSGHESMNNPVVRKEGSHDRFSNVRNASSITESTFLPSLSVGFIQGSDDSDLNEAADMPRKNRRGQRARRAIWEKKYGRHANHKKKEVAVASAKKTARLQMRNVSKSHDAQRSIMSSREGGRKKLDITRTSKDDEPLHPSWEAKRKQKDKDKGNIVPSQGQKIKF